MASDLGILLTIRHPWTAKAVRVSWFLLGIGSERELALRWRRPRYQLMVAESGGEAVEWVRYTNGHTIPICTRREGERRRVAFLRTHPECTAWVERRGRTDA